MNDTQSTRPVHDPYCKCENGPHLACRLLQAWWSQDDNPSAGFRNGDLVDNRASTPCPECGEPKSAHCVTVGTRRFVVVAGPGPVYSACNRSDARRVAEHWAEQGGYLVDSELVPDLTELDLGELTRLLAPGGAAQQEVNQAVLAELTQRNLPGRRRPAPVPAPSAWDVLYQVTTDGCGTVRAETGAGEVLGERNVEDEEDSVAATVRELTYLIRQHADEHP